MDVSNDDAPHVFHLHQQVPIRTDCDKTVVRFGSLERELTGCHIQPDIVVTRAEFTIISGLIDVDSADGRGRRDGNVDIVYVVENGNARQTVKKNAWNDEAGKHRIALIHFQVIDGALPE